MGTLRLGSSVVVPSVTINGGSQPVIDPLSITPTTSQQTITAPSGTDGYSPITVSAVTSSIDANITSGNIKSGVTILGVNGSVVELDGEQINITPTTSQQVITPTSPKNAITQATVSAVTSSIDANITAGNIKKDVEILGVTGTYEGSGSTLITKTITQNGVYDAQDDGADGYSEVTVNVPGSNTNILKSVVADGKSELSGTPTPSIPVDITCNNGVLTKTANEANYISNNVTLGYWLRNSDGQPEASGANFYTNMMPVKPNTSYVCFGRRKDTNVISGYNRIAWYNASGTWIRNSTYSQGTPGIDTSPSNAAYARFHCNADGSTVTQELVDSYNWTFCEGNQEVAYVPFLQTVGTPETITDNDSNVAKVENLFRINDTYIDVQDIVTGRIIRKTNMLILDGTETWASYNQYNPSVFTSTFTLQYSLPYGSKFNALCNYYENTTSGIVPENNQIIVETDSSGHLVLKIHNDNFTDPADFKAWLSQKYIEGNPVIVITPQNNNGSITEIVTPQVLVHSPITVAGSLQNLVVSTTTYDSVVHYIEKRMVKIDNVNTLTNSSPSGTSIPTAPIDLKDVQRIDEYVLEYAHRNNNLILPRVAFINSESLTSIIGDYACDRAFFGTNIIKTGLNYVIQISGNSACFGTFYNCTSLTDIGLDRLEGIGASGNSATCGSMFYGNTSLEKADFKSLAGITGNLSCQYMFYGCTKLKEIKYQKYVNNSSTSQNYFSNMLSGVAGCIVHFPVASSAMSSWSDVVAGFGGTNTTILFDIISTIVVGGNTYVRSPIDSTNNTIAWKYDGNTYYTSGTSEPQTSDTLYSDSACTVSVGTITSMS